MVKSSVKKVAMALSITSVFCGVNVTDSVASAEIHESMYKEYMNPPSSVAELERQVNAAIQDKIENSPYSTNKNAKQAQASDGILYIQKRIMEVNGLSYGQFTSVYDYKTKVRPVIYIDGYKNTTAAGMGTIFTGLKYNISASHDIYKDSFYYFVIGHETGHCVLGHAYLNPTNLNQAVVYENEEREANEYSLDTCAKIGECSWGAYHDAFFNAGVQAGESISERDSVNKYIFEKSKGALSSPNRTLLYKGLRPEDLYNKVQNQQFIDYIVTYAFGQFAFAIDKGIMNTKYVHLEDFNGDKLHKSALVFRSPSIYGGYKVIALFVEPKDDVENIYNQLVETHNAKLNYYSKAVNDACFMYALMKLIKDYEDNGVSGKPQIY